VIRFVLLFDLDHEETLISLSFHIAAVKYCAPWYRQRQQSSGRLKMNMTHWLNRSLVVLVALTLGASTALAQKKETEVKLPDAVMKTFKAKFPKAEIQKTEVEEENGVTVYDIEFKEGDVEKETDITADGIMLEFTIVIEAKAVPAAAMKTIEKHAEGAKMKRIERVEISYETKDGKVIKLEKPVTHYAVEMTRGKQTAEVVVTPQGAIVEEPKWEDIK
jgi:uncharacterized membrane protein YkoI